MELTLSEEERELLLTIMEQRYRVIQIEIAHTDHHEFKALLRRREDLLESILRRLQTAAPQKVA
jgi:hypothetical protein